ncbi:uncharacterized protein EMH_0007140 [Eimeria mitis]|uniref:OST48 middle domain-containing protein n=1 Tax=Eimeria mitis TaxID=44415 RepID=U6JZ41_9EIME|nr:uncharacterized protein EMH_0007140 [Eimeria mitis]CDJ30755.1 hypothetical protein EMH_0007140 [Eimeria mitis]
MVERETPQGLWRPFEGQDVQVEYVLGDPLLRLFLQREADSPTFSAEFKAPDRAGILKFVLRHARLGYSSLLIHSLAPLRTPRTDDADQLQPSGGFYYFVAVAVLLGMPHLPL